mmetsp:Transcript_13952/g.20424  ORF Transcript_13952/g.20424 Transcript_13952/m.20424 type:complete len:88 (+) Transcript_13952:2365-2628(+)
MSECVWKVMRNAHAFYFYWRIDGWVAKLFRVLSFFAHPLRPWAMATVTAVPKVKYMYLFLRQRSLINYHKLKTSKEKKIFGNILLPP